MALNKVILLQLDKVPDSWLSQRGVTRGIVGSTNKVMHLFPVVMWASKYKICYELFVSIEYFSVAKINLNLSYFHFKRKNKYFLV